MAQAELEAREHSRAYQRVKAFHRPDGAPVHIETTRPELIPAVVAPSRTPTTSATGTSSARRSRRRCSARSSCSPTPPPSPTRAPASRCCTFGDLTDVQWWRELQLPVRTVVGRDGRLLRDPGMAGGQKAAAAYDDLAGKTTFSAREAMVEKPGQRDLEGEPKNTQRMANFYEKGDKPLEIVPLGSGTRRTAAATRSLRRASSSGPTRSSGCRSTCGTGTPTGSTA